MDHPRPEDPPRVLIECGGNMLRRTRGGKKALLNTLWPKLDLIVSIDFRISQTGLYSDYVLPAAQHYEKIGFHIPTPHLMNLTFSDKAAEPAGEARNEWQIYHAIFEKIAERASERGLTAYKDTKGMTRRYAALPGAYSMKGFLLDEERLADEQIRDSALAGTLPMGTSLRTLREKGHVRFIDWGLSPMALAQASPIKPNETHVPFRDHTERGDPFPTYARRAQFYIDHPWFLEAGEELPVWKPNPNMGGDYPIGMTSGHNRWSIHTMNQANEVILGTHRGEPIGGHGGSDEVYSCQTALLTDQHRGYALLMNEQHLIDGMVVSGQLQTGIRDLLIGRQPDEGGISVTLIGIAILAVFLIALVSTVRSFVRMRGWNREARSLKAPQIVWRIAPHLLVPALTLIVLLGVMLSPSFARLVYGQTLTVKRIEYVQAAVAFGASLPTRLFQVVLPISRAALVTTIIFTFVGTWNALEWPLLVTFSENWRPISYGLYAFTTEAGSDLNLLMAGSVITLVPVLVLYLFAQRQFTEGIATTGLKG